MNKIEYTYITYRADRLTLSFCPPISCLPISPPRYHTRISLGCMRIQFKQHPHTTNIRTLLIKSSP